MAPSSSSSRFPVGAREDMEKVKSEAHRAQYTKVDPQGRPPQSSSSSRAIRGGGREEGGFSHHRHHQSSGHHHKHSRDRDRSRSPYRRERTHQGSSARSRSRSPWRLGKNGSARTGGGDERRESDRAERASERDQRARPENHSGNDDRRNENASRLANASAETTHPSSMDSQKRSFTDSHNSEPNTEPDSRSVQVPSGTSSATANNSRRDPDRDAQQAPVSRLAKRRRIAEVMAEANARQQRLMSPVAASPGALSSAMSSGRPSPQPSAGSPMVGSANDSPKLMDLDTDENASSAVNGVKDQAPPVSAAPEADPEQNSGEPSGNGQAPAGQSDFTLEKTDPLVPVSAVNETSAADYDPNQDMNEDRPDHRLHETNDASGVQPGNAPPEPKANGSAPKGFDMFALDDDDDDNEADMFAPISTKEPASAQTATAPAAGLRHDYDDQDGYLRIIQREILDGRYSIQTSLGRGVFASVVLADDVQTNTKVAIKIARQNDTMLKAAQLEVKFLKLLQDRDSTGKVPIIRLLHTFTHKKHFCLVFESLECDLRELLKKHGRNTGLDISAVRTYARQMFQALHHLEKAELLHADLKPDNILVHKDNQYIKICDLGSAMFIRDAEVTDMLVSRFYRAPEIMIGMAYSYPIDMWAIGCTLFELYTGRILFNGQDNNKMLRMIQECRGKVPSRMIKKAVQPTGHFSPDNTFIGEETNTLTGKVISKPMYFQQPQPGKDLKARLAVGLPSPTGDAKKDVEARKLHDDFADLLDQCLKLDPEQRIKPAQALRHRFFQTAAVAPPPPKTPGLPFMPTSVLKRD